MSGTITIYDIENLPGDQATLQVISIKDVLEGERYFVRVAELGNPDECEDTPFEDYPQAYAHWRNTLSKVGIKVPFRAPVQVSFVEDAADPTRGATEIFYELHSLLSKTSAGSEEATEIRDRFMADPDFIEHHADILAITKGDNWISAVIRTACRRIAAKERAETDRIVQEQLGSIATFGAF